MNIDIYTDARSGLAKVIQIGAVVIDENDNEYKFSEKTTIGLIKSNWNRFNSIKFKANSTIAEAYAIYRILEKLPLNSHNIRFFTDSEQLFNFTNSIYTPKCQLIKVMIDSIKERMANDNIQIMWIKGHNQIYGNTIADSLCKSNIRDFCEFTQDLIHR